MFKNVYIYINNKNFQSDFRQILIVLYPILDNFMHFRRHFIINLHTNTPQTLLMYTPQTLSMYTPQIPPMSVDDPSLLVFML